MTGALTLARLVGMHVAAPCSHRVGPRPAHHDVEIDRPLDLALIAADLGTALAQDRVGRGEAGR